MFSIHPKELKAYYSCGYLPEIKQEICHKWRIVKGLSCTRRSPFVLGNCFGMKKYRFWDSSNTAQSEASRRHSRHGAGGVLFLLGVLFGIAGVIMTSVAYSQSQYDAVPSVFFSLGPILITLAILCLSIGIYLSEIIKLGDIVKTCGANSDTKHLCKQTCVKCRCCGWNTVVKLNSSQNNIAVREDSFYSADQCEIVRQKRFQNANTPREGKVQMSTGKESLDDTGAQAVGSDDLVSDPEPHTTEKTHSLVSLRHCKVFPADDETLFEQVNNSDRTNET